MQHFNEYSEFKARPNICKACGWTTVVGPSAFL